MNKLRHRVFTLTAIPSEIANHYTMEPPKYDIHKHAFM